MARDDATFVRFQRAEPAISRRHLTRVVTVSAGLGGAIGALMATLAVVAFFHGREVEAAPPPRMAMTMPPKAVAATHASTGVLVLASFPPARVVEGDHVLCAQTPCFAVSLAAGPHDLAFQRIDGALQKHVRVEVVGDQTRELRLDMAR